MLLWAIVLRAESINRSPGDLFASSVVKSGIYEQKTDCCNTSEDSLLRLYPHKEENKAVIAVVLRHHQTLLSKTTLLAMTGGLSLPRDFLSLQMSSHLLCCSGSWTAGCCRQCTNTKLWHSPSNSQLCTWLLEPIRKLQASFQWETSCQNLIYDWGYFTCFSSK